jgi:hypothetical protein
MKELIAECSVAAVQSYVSRMFNYAERLFGLFSTETEVNIRKFFSDELHILGDQNKGMF